MAFELRGGNYKNIPPTCAKEDNAESNIRGKGSGECESHSVENAAVTVA